MKTKPQELTIGGINTLTTSQLLVLSGLMKTDELIRTLTCNLYRPQSHKKAALRMIANNREEADS